MSVSTYLTKLSRRQFSLRTLLITTLGISLVCVILAQPSYIYRRESAIAEQVAALRGKVYWTTDKRLGFNVMSRLGLAWIYRRISRVDLTGTNVTDSTVAALSKLNQVFQITLDKTAVTNQGLKHLSKLDSLVILSLASTSISDEGLEHLQELRSLEQLYVERTDVSNDGLRRLARSLPKLDARAMIGMRIGAEINYERQYLDAEFMDVESVHVRNNHDAATLVPFLAELSNLREILLDEVNGLPEFLHSIDRFEITSLEIRLDPDEELSPLTWACIGRASKLRKLAICRSTTIRSKMNDGTNHIVSIDREVLRSWSRLHELGILSLPDTVNIDDGDVDVLMGFSRLKWLDLRNAAISATGMERLVELPALERLILPGNSQRESREAELTIISRTKMSFNYEEPNASGVDVPLTRRSFEAAILQHPTVTSLYRIDLPRSHVFMRLTNLSSW